MNDDVIAYVFVQLRRDCPADHHFIVVIIEVNEPAFHHVFFERPGVKALADALDKDAEGFSIGLYNAELVGEFLNVAYEGILLRVLVQVDLVVHGLFFRGIVHGELLDYQVAAEAVDLFFHSLLKALHDKKRNNGCGKSERYADNGDLVDRG